MVAAANILTIKIEAEQPNANVRQKVENHLAIQYVKMSMCDFLNHTAGEQNTFLRGSHSCLRLSFSAKIYYMSFAIFALLKDQENMSTPC